MTSGLSQLISVQSTLARHAPYVDRVNVMQVPLNRGNGALARLPLRGENPYRYGAGFASGENLLLQRRQAASQNVFNFLQRHAPDNFIEQPPAELAREHHHCHHHNHFTGREEHHAHDHPEPALRVPRHHHREPPVRPVRGARHVPDVAPEALIRAVVRTIRPSQLTPVPSVHLSGPARAPRGREQRIIARGGLRDGRHRPGPLLGHRESDNSLNDDHDGGHLDGRMRRERPRPHPRPRLRRRFDRESDDESRLIPQMDDSDGARSWRRERNRPGPWARFGGESDLPSRRPGLSD